MQCNIRFLGTCPVGQVASKFHLPAENFTCPMQLASCLKVSSTLFEFVYTVQIIDFQVRNPWKCFFSNILKHFSLDYIPHNHTFLFKIFCSFNMLSSSFRTLADLGLKKLHAITSLMLN